MVTLRRSMLTAANLQLVAFATAVLLLASLFGSTPASAHARYKSSTPGTGEAITASPARVEITFTQEIQKIAGGYSVTVVKDRGLDVTAGAAVINDADRTMFSVALQPDLAPGRYVVNWTGTSDEDGDLAGGGFSFYLNYQPNSVDLANDAQLALLGAEEATPGATASAPAPTAAPPTVAATTTSSSPRPAATPTASSTNDDGGLSTGALVAIVIVAAIAGIGIGFGAWQVSKRDKRT